MKMKILQLTKKFPYPLKDGEAIAVSYMAKALHRLGSELTLLSMNTIKHPFDIKTLPADFNHYKAIHLVDIDNRVKVLDAFLNLFSNKSYHIERFVSPEFDNKLKALLQNEEFDIVQMETLYLAPYIETIRKYSKAKICMRSHNVEHEIWKRIAYNTTLGAKKWYLQLLSRRLEDFEINSLNQYDLMAAITQRDLNFFKHLGLKIPAIVAPIGLDLDNYKNKKQASSKDFCFIGSLDWLPNLEGVQWLIENVWPKVIEKAPETHFHIAGRNCPDWLKNIQIKGIFVHGEVSDAMEFIGSHCCMLVPLLSGSGMRVKILEGMAMERLVISTSLGLEGIDAEAGKEVLIANSANEFIDAILSVVNDIDKAEKMGKTAALFIKQHFDNLSIAKELSESYKRLLTH
jgi:glycosyltransferase involved in cell wall biosynthesis